MVCAESLHVEPVRSMDWKLLKVNVLITHKYVEARMESQTYEVVFGKERQLDKPIIALTNCEVVFSSKDELDKCIVAVMESDERLGARPVEAVFYDWQLATVIRGLTMFFGVRWYDREYFDQNRDIYKNKMHSHLFSKFGVSAESFKVNHFVAG
jgi:hypothetical protein